MALENVRFDESPRVSLSAQPVGPGGVVASLRDLAKRSGLDATSDLYNRARDLAQEYEFEQAARELGLLLALDPDDAEAHLLHAKVRTGLQDWATALESLDRAAALGARVPADLRERIDEKAAAERAATGERMTALRAREEGEITALRQEARRLRSENARLVGRVHDLSAEVRRWAWLTTGVAGAAGLFILINLAIGVGSGGSTSAPTEAPVAATSDAPAEAPVVADAGATTADAAPAADAAPSPANPPTAGALAQQAQAALAGADGLDGTKLTLSVQAGKASVSGTVTTAAQRRRAEQVVGEVPGIAAVDVGKVKILARTKGAKHTVVSGDSLSRIARDYYGDASLAKKIVAANPKTLGGKTDLRLGMELKIPAVE